MFQNNYHMQTQQNALKDDDNWSLLLLEAVGFAYNKDNADFSSTHVKDITVQ